jgi:small subunit ribosomal protein S12
MTLSQIFVRHQRSKRKRKHLKSALDNCPQKLGCVIKVEIRSPKKPHSARRKTMRLRLTNKKRPFCYIPGIGHSVQKFNYILMRGGRRRDIPGMKYTGIRGIESFSIPVNRRTARSKYGIQKIELIHRPVISTT